MNILALGGILSVVLNEVREGERERRPVKERNVALLSRAGNEWLCVYAVFLEVDLKECFPILIPSSEVKYNHSGNRLLGHI